MRKSLLLVAALAAPAAAQPKATGTITGAVTWKGAAPARAALDRASDPECAKSPRLAEDVVVTDGKLRDVHVRLPVGKAGTHAAPAAAVTVTQRECMYSPRVVGVVAGQQLDIVNDDATFHNVRGNLGPKIAWNLGQAADAPKITRANLGKPGDVVSLHCDVHPWMAAWAVVTDHPFFDVTEADGAFELRDVPVGTYTLEAWHPTLGLKTARVKVKKGKTAKAAFVYGAR